MRKMRVFGVGVIGIGFLILVVGCGSSMPVEPVMEITQTSTPTFMPTETPTPTIEPTITPIFENLEIKDFEYVDLCYLENESNTERIHSYPGLILKVKKDRPNSFKLTYVDSSQMERVIFENFQLNNWLRISPDYHWIADKYENGILVRNISTYESIDRPWNFDW